MRKVVGPERAGRGRRCVVCKAKFGPHPRLGMRQVTCGGVACRRTHKAQYRQKYRRRNQEAEAGYAAKRKGLRPDDYWKKYRASHPESTKRNRAGSRLRKLLRGRGLQRQLDIVEVTDPIERLHGVVEFATSYCSLLGEVRGKKAA